MVPWGGLPASHPSSWPTQQPPLSGAVDAVGMLPIELNVQLAGCEIDIGTLQGLQPGDVLRTQHSVDAPATVTDAAGVPLFRAYPGRRAGSRSVALAPLEATQREPSDTEEQS
ncbi:FliM/FliN family flagellar motor switch protein [Ramlibacter terrae]|uniref:FliM/FliN family flagellar motor switch protein n=1 Tax=Ramlibacter terrae TaxID=2732511 RepID=A0ABX6P999_9BURK|nr:FliM/FliN family flagellar motor switch protein [Ramlibacter terrae]